MNEVIMDKQEFKGYLLVLAGGAIWGTIGPFIKVMADWGASSLLISFLRMSFAFLIMLFITLYKFRLQALRISKTELVSCALLGLICHGIYNVFYTLAVTLTGVSISAVLLNIAPVFTALTSFIFLHEPMDKRKITAFAINILGCIFAVTNGTIDSSNISFIGILYGVGAGICYALTAVIALLAGKNTNVFTLSTYSYFFAALFLAIYDVPWSDAHLYNADILTLGFLFALIPTAIAYLLYYQGVQYIKETSRVPVIASVETLVAIVLGILFFHDQLHLVSSIGIILVFISIWLIDKK